MLSSSAYWKEEQRERSFPENKKLSKRQHSYMTWMMIRMLLPLFGKTFFHAFKNKNKILGRTKIHSWEVLFLWMTKDAWGTIFWITFYRNSLFNGKIAISFKKNFQHVKYIIAFSFRKVLVSNKVNLYQNLRWSRNI